MTVQMGPSPEAHKLTCDIAAVGKHPIFYYVSLGSSAAQAGPVALLTHFRSHVD